MKLDRANAFSRLTTVEQLSRFLSIFGGNLEDILNNGLTFNDNFRGQIISCTFPSANTDTTFQHQLNRLVTGYLSLSMNAALIVYDGSNAPQGNQVTLKASAAGTVRLLIF